jgi:N-acetylmuramoyl-L-alanine amidase.
MTLKKRQKTDYIVIHCSKTSQTEDIGINELKAKFIDEGWSDIGYHYVIRRDGTLEEGREVESVGGHLFGWDSVCLGICLVGVLGLITIILKQLTTQKLKRRL